MPSVKYASDAILGHIYLDAQIFQTHFIVPYLAQVTQLKITGPTTWLDEITKSKRQNGYRLNSPILADKETGYKKSKYAVKIRTGSSFCRHYSDKPKVEVCYVQHFHCHGPYIIDIGAVIQFLDLNVCEKISSSQLKGSRVSNMRQRRYWAT